MEVFKLLVLFFGWFRRTKSASRSRTLFSTLGSRRLDDDPYRQEDEEVGQGAHEALCLENLLERS